jgi:hypothetical protein
MVVLSSMQRNAGHRLSSIQINLKYAWESQTHQQQSVPPCPWCQMQRPKLPSWWRHDVVFIFYNHVWIK